MACKLFARSLEPLLQACKSHASSLEPQLMVSSLLSLIAEKIDSGLPQVAFGQLQRLDFNGFILSFCTFVQIVPTDILSPARSCPPPSSSRHHILILFHHFFHSSAGFIFEVCNCPEEWQVIQRQGTVQHHSIMTQPHVIPLNGLIVIIMAKPEVPE